MSEAKLTTGYALNLKELTKPFPVADVEWRVSRAGKTRDGRIWCKVLPYVTNRAIQDRLDAVVGPENWRNRFVAGPSGGVLCGVSIFLPDRKQWVTKWDGAENTGRAGSEHAVKGGLSSAMKRAAVQWGIGRYLYDLEEAFGEVGEDGPCFGSFEDVGGQRVNFRWTPPALPAWALPDAAATREELVRGSTPLAKLAEEIDRAGDVESLNTIWRERAAKLVNGERSAAIRIFRDRKAELGAAKAKATTVAPQPAPPPAPKPAPKSARPNVA